MNRDDIIRMAQEAGCGWTHNGTEPLLTGEAQIQRFAALVAEREREACAKVCDFRARSYSMETDMWAHEHVSEARICAAAIRARGEQEHI